MKKRILQFLTTYFLFVLLFVLQKPIFMVYYHELYTDASIGDYFQRYVARLASGFLTGKVSDCYSGLPAYRFRLDEIFHITPYPARLFRNHLFCDVLYLHCRSGLVRLLGIPAGCYSDLLFLLLPEGAMASVSFWFILLGVLAMLIYAAILYGIFYTVLIREKTPLKIPYQRQYVPSFFCC